MTQEEIIPFGIRLRIKKYDPKYLEYLIEESRARVALMSPEEKADMVRKQGEGWAKAEAQWVTGELIKEAVRKAVDDHQIWTQNNLNSIIIDNVNKAMRAAQEAAVKGALR